MAFSWNPFNRKTQSQPEKPEQTLQEQSYRAFAHVNNDIERIVASRSVISQALQDNTPLKQALPIWQTAEFDSNLLLLPIATNKTQRLSQYRTMANFTETQWCLDELADEFINENEFGEFITLTLPENKAKLNETRRNILQEQFKQYINLFKFRDNGYNYIKRFLVEGELAWENIIDPKQPDLGIRAVKFLPAEYYETLIDAKTNSPAGLIFDTEALGKDISEILTNSYMGSVEIFNRISPVVTTSFSLRNNKCIPLLWSQLTYISSGETSHDGLINYPLIEKTRQAYHQLALLQEAAVVLRVTRAPERLLYNVSTGRMSDNLAQEFVRNFANSLKAKKVANPDGNIAQVYNPVSMLEAYVFGKSMDSEGTTVESVGSSADYEQLGDIEYFLRRFMKQFKVPFSRYKTPENATPTPDQLNYEEHSFLKSIIRMQRRFALGFRNGYITHLKLRGLWDKYNLKDSDIDVSFVKPSMFELLEVQQLVEAKMNIYNLALGDNDEFSKQIAMKKFLKMTDDEIKENYESLIKEKMLNELGEYYAGKVAEKNGLAGWSVPIKYHDDEVEEIKKSSDTANSDKSNDDGSETEADTEESGDTNVEDSTDTSEPAEPPSPTFGLG